MSWTEDACRVLELSPSSVRLLGRGFHGEAYETPRQTVMKITSDPQEVLFISMAHAEVQCPGVPVIHRPPVELSEGVHVYERESLEDLPFLAPSLRPLNVIGRSILPMSFDERLKRYDEVLFSEQASQTFPYVIDAMRRFRSKGVLLWDCKHGNLGMRGTCVVIRDARCVDARMHARAHARSV